MIAPDRRGRLLVRGPRGSGLTTALRVLAAAVAERSALRPLPFERLWSDPSGRPSGPWLALRPS